MSLEVMEHFRHSILDCTFTQAWDALRLPILTLDQVNYLELVLDIEETRFIRELQEGREALRARVLELAERVKGWQQAYAEDQADE
jgi:FtsZ-binding cell division protein ZapB